tara:strand:+ start:2205 stop:2420 length:216 start_codon:yes stop_codon:yes gene_type:complete
MLKEAIWQWQVAVTFVCEQAKVVEVMDFVTEDVRKLEWRVGQLAAQTVVYVPKAVDQELVSVLQVQHVDVV